MRTTISRRRFLTYTVAGVAVMSVQAGCNSTQTTSSNDRFGGFRFGIQANGRTTCILKSNLIRY